MPLMLVISDIFAILSAHHSYHCYILSVLKIPTRISKGSTVITVDSCKLCIKSCQVDTLPTLATASNSSVHAMPCLQC